MTFKQMTAIEPELRDLLREARQVKARGESFCANKIWYRDFKPRLLRLVGWEARQFQLRTSSAYDIAYTRIYNALPNCKNCGCL